MVKGGEGAFSPERCAIARSIFGMLMSSYIPVSPLRSGCNGTLFGSSAHREGSITAGAAKRSRKVCLINDALPWKLGRVCPVHQA